MEQKVFEFQRRTVFLTLTDRTNPNEPAPVHSRPEFLKNSGEIQLIGVKSQIKIQSCNDSDSPYVFLLRETVRLEKYNFSQVIRKIIIVIAISYNLTRSYKLKTQSPRTHPSSHIIRIEPSNFLFKGLIKSDGLDNL